MPTLEVNSDGTVEGTKILVNGKKAENIKRLIMDIDPASQDAYPKLNLSLCRNEDGDQAGEEVGLMRALVNCHGKKFKLEIE